MRRADLWPFGAERPSGASTGRRCGDGDASRLPPIVPGDGRGALRSSLARLGGVFQSSHGGDAGSAPLSRGREHASGTGRADGGAFGPLGGGARSRGPDFAEHVPHNGYTWWYVDALSGDGRQGLTIIAFVGSVFSPYFAWARRRGRGDPENHCALNVALYGARATRWAMTERKRDAVSRERSVFTIGPSAVSWDGNALTFEIREVSVPVPRRLRGTVRLYPEAITDYKAALDARRLHVWRPYAPMARVEVAMTDPSLAWAGDGYFDSNAGAAPLEDGFVDWDWSRAKLKDGAAVLYDMTRRDGGTPSLALRFDRAGLAREIDPPARAGLPSTALWRVRRATRADEGSHPTVRRTFEDTPFYARSLLSTRLMGEPVTAFHESLSLDRFRSPIVRAMLPFRMPRV